MAGIFINYRRDDAPGVAGRLYDYLAKSFSRRDLFIDVDYIKPGLDFVKQLDSQVAQCDVMLALIGPQWLAAEDERGSRKLHGNKDYVRIEIASALRRDIPVIPILVHGAEMPAEDELPEDLKSLTRRQALELRHTRFAADADAIAAALKPWQTKHKKKWGWSLAAAALAGIAGVWLFSLWPSPAPPVQKSPTTNPQTTESPQASDLARLASIKLAGLGQTAELSRTGTDDWKWAENEGAFKFRTVEETNSELVIHDSTRDMYHRLNLLTGETFWRTGTSGSWTPHYRVVSKSMTQTFNDPTVESLPLDGCLYFARECGEAAASAWCASKGLGKAADLTGYRIVPQTYVLGDRVLCETGPAISCGAITSVTCSW